MFTSRSTATLSASPISELTAFLQYSSLASPLEETRWHYMSIQLICLEAENADETDEPAEQYMALEHTRGTLLRISYWQRPFLWTAPPGETIISPHNRSGSGGSFQGTEPWSSAALQTELRTKLLSKQLKSILKRQAEPNQVRTRSRPVFCEWQVKGTWHHSCRRMDSFLTASVPTRSLRCILSPTATKLHSSYQSFSLSLMTAFTLSFFFLLLPPSYSSVSDCLSPHYFT